MFVAHVDEVDMPAIERAARRGLAGRAAPDGQLRARATPARTGPIISRGAMVTAAIAKGGGARARVVGKPSRAAVAEISTRLGMPANELAVIGDDLGMDIALGRMGGSRTVLVRSGISGAIELDRLPESRRPDAVLDGVADLARVAVNRIELGQRRAARRAPG